MNQSENESNQREFSLKYILTVMNQNEEMFNQWNACPRRMYILFYFFKNLLLQLFKWKKLFH